MKFRKITILGLTFVFAGSVAAFAASCSNQPEKQPPDEEYTFEDGRPDGDLAEPDAGFKVDGVLDEAAYNNIQWLEGPVLRPYYTSDGQGVYYDYDIIQEKSESAGQVKMGTYYGENGVYIAYSYKEQAGKVCYVNPSRKSYRNSGVELHIGVPSSVTMTGDETVSRLTVNANGALTVAKTQGSTWMAPFGTEDSENMPYVGLTGNGTRTDENADRTEYTFELFIPWGYFDEVGGEGTAQSMKDGGDLVVAAGVIVANNYTGTGQTDREYYVLSSRLDEGSWSKAQGWYHFNKDGLVAYDISIAQPQNGAVQEWMGFDTAAKNSSLTFVTKADEGYALKEFRVNGVAVPSDYIHYDMYTTLGVETESNVQKAYIKIPQKEITGDIEVEAVFEALASGEQTLSASVYGVSTDNPLANTKVTFTRGSEVKEGVTDENGILTISGLTAGLYDVAIDDITYKKLDDYVFYSSAANTQIVFERNVVALEGRENIASNYREIYGKVGSLAGGFVFSGFFGYEADSYDELTNFTNTVYFITDKAASEQVGFRFTKWGNYLMLKYEGAEYHFEGDAEAVSYFKENKGVSFIFSVDAEGKISAYIERAEGEWVLLSTNTSVRFPIDKELEAINFSKQDDFDVSHYAVLKDGELKIGTSKVDIPVNITINGGTEVDGGSVVVTENAALGDEITVTLTPDTNYSPLLKVDGATVEIKEGADGVYTYTFTASKQSYALNVAFERVAGDYIVYLDIDEGLAVAADNFTVTLTNGTLTKTAVKGESNDWTVSGLAYGKYTVTVAANDGGYTVLTYEAEFKEGSESVTLNVTSDNYGVNRKYALKGEGSTENPGVQIAENLGATENGFVFEGFLGVGGSGNLSYIGDKNYAAALRFTTESEYQFRLCFYIWNGQYWLIKAFQEGQENKSASHEFGFSGNSSMIEYVKAQNGITVAIAAEADGTLTVYAKESESQWVSLGEWESPFPVTEKITKVEVLRMFQSGIEGWTATVDGELRFGTAEANLPVSVTVNNSETVTGGEVEVSEDAVIGDEIILTFKPASGYELSEVRVDGNIVSCEQGDGVYTYTFTATKSNYSVEVLFGELRDLAITVDTTEISEAAGDLSVTLNNASGETVNLTNAENVWTADHIPYGSYTIIVRSVSGGYTVLEQTVTFEEGSESFTVSITPDNYGANRKYALKGEGSTENPGVQIAENLGATANGFVFEGFLGVGGSGNLANIGSNSFAAALRFTTESEYQFRLCFYIWEGGTWLIKAFQEGQENKSASHEFGFSGNSSMIEYVKAQNGITVAIAAEADGTLTVYAKESESQWVSLGEWESPFPVTEKITKVEVLRMFQSGIEGWTATVDGELRFGTAEANLPVSVTVNNSETVTGGEVEVTENAVIGDEITITITPASGYELSEAKVDGKAVSCEQGDGVYTYTFTAAKSNYSVEVLFGKLSNLAITVDTTAIPEAAGNLSVTLTNAAGETVSLTNESNTWTAQVPYGIYTIIITSVSGDYTVLTQEVEFKEGNESFAFDITADNYGANRKYELNAEVNKDGNVILAEDLGTVTQFVYTGFMGLRSTTTKVDGSLQFTAETVLHFADGDKLSMQFICWSNNTQQIKFSHGSTNKEFRTTQACSPEVYEKMVQDGGVYFAIVMDNGTFRVYAKYSETEWVQLHLAHDGDCANAETAWVSGIDFGAKKISSVAFYNPTDNSKDKAGAKLVDGVLQFGTTDTGIAVSITGTGSVAGGTVDATQATLGGLTTVTLTPEEGYVFSSLSVDGKAVSCTAGDDGVYTYTFMTSKMSHELSAVFEKTGGAYTVNATITDGLNAAEDLEIVLSNGSAEFEAVKGAGNVWTTASIPYGEYTIIVRSVSGGYTVLEQTVTFEEGSESFTVSITPDNYGANRKYALKGEGSSENPGVQIAENLGATANGFVFEGVLGVGGSGNLTNIGSNNYAAALRFTTESEYQFRLCFYIWNGKYWLIKAFQEGQENTASSHEFAFTGNSSMIEYVKAQNGITVAIAAEADGTLTVYAKESETQWISLGEWESPFPVTEKITKVEVLRMFQSGIEGWTATVDGELRFGTAEANLPVSVTVNGGAAITGGTVKVTENAVIGDEITVTITPASNYELSEVKVDGKVVSCEQGDGVYTYTFTATKSNYSVEVLFGELHYLAITVDTTAIPEAAGNLSVTLTNAAGETVSLTNEGDTWTASTPYGKYTLAVRPASGDYMVISKEVEFGEGSESVTLTVTGSNYGINRVYALEGENDQEYSGGILAENIGSTESFVFEGFLGVTEGSESLSELIEANNGSFGTGLRFVMSDGNSFRIAFVANNGTWSIRCYWQDSKNAEKDNATFVIEESVKNYVSANGGVNIIAVAEKVGVTSSVMIFIETAEGVWERLGTYTNANIPLGKAIDQVTVAKMWINDNPDRTPYVNGTLRFGTTETGIGVEVINSEEITGGQVSVSANPKLGEEVTITFKPSDGYMLFSLTVDGEIVEFAETDGVYTYTFTATKTRYTFNAVFAQQAELTLNVAVENDMENAIANDIAITISNGSATYTLAQDSTTATKFTASIPYGTYTVMVMSESGGYLVFKEEIEFSNTSSEITLQTEVTADNYGANRKYALKGEGSSENPGVQIAENLGATANGFVFEGVLGVGGSGNLTNIGSNNYAAALRFTTESEYQFRLCFYIWNGKYWLIKAFQEGQENTASSHEFAFTGNSSMIEYVKAQNGITVAIAAEADGTLTVYAKESETQWISLGEWESPFPVTEKITKVEVLRMFQSGIEGWTATVDGELRFGTVETGIPAVMS